MYVVIGDENGLLALAECLPLIREVVEKMISARGVHKWLDNGDGG